jgi:SET domain-containing protein
MDRIVPPNVYIDTSKIPGAGLGAFAALPIRKNEVLGDYTGRECTIYDDGDYVLLIEGHNGRKRIVRCIDAEDPATSGWPRYLNSVMRKNKSDQNCTFFINGDKISVKAIKDIMPGSELLVFYGDQYF